MGKSGNGYNTKMSIYPALVTLALEVQGNKITHYLEFPEVLAPHSYLFFLICANTVQMA